ncbi:MAG: hypothetical protein KF799_11235 [Bdellovibrionales bacterium]|nr:hypothetical protein [Bdellovibrionales bacterium]
MSRPVANEITASTFTNHLHLFTDEGKAKPSEVAGFLEISLNKLAKALGVDTLREDRLGPVATLRLQELASALEIVAQSFGGDRKKARFWINTPNLHLGAAIPKNLILIGRYKKLLEFVQAVRDE